MSYEVYLDGRKITLTDDQIAQIKEVCETDSQAILTSKKISELTGLNFLVKDYQRGYRWTQSEVQDLLDDINALSIEEDGYCMQPLVVKQLTVDHQENARRKLDKTGLQEYNGILPDGVYELLDGQQRLTTIWLINSFLGNENSEKYTIYYEMARDVDAYYISQAQNAIKEWFSTKPNFNINLTPTGRIRKGTVFEWNNDERDVFLSKLNKLFFIWYEVTDRNISAERVFKSINEGKIELTNAELFKALLLNPDNVSPDEHHKLQQIAFEWDKVENGLRDDDFWYFISQDDVEKTSLRTRIDYVVEIYARELNRSENIGLNPDKDRFSFLAIQKYLERKKTLSEFDAIKDIWEHIVGVYDKLYSWYKDEELYHTIGFLVASEDKNRGSKAVVSEIVSDLYQTTRNLTIEMTRSEVRKTIREQIIPLDAQSKPVPVDNLMYEYQPGEPELVNKATLKRILLFSNIYSVIFYKRDPNIPLVTYTRFPYKNYNQIGSWDIEHVSPRTVEKDIEKACACLEDFKNNIQSLIDDLGDDQRAACLREYLSQDLTDDNYKTQPGYDICCRLWSDYATELSQTPDNNICNLVLLNSSINRSYGNAFFNRKRKEIIENDQKGVFVPVCTKNVFMKYYSDSLINPTQWTDSDKKKYKEYLEEMFNEVKGWK